MQICSFIVCDDIRREFNGKHMLIGVYDSLALTAPKGQSIIWPVILKLAFFIKVLDIDHDLQADAYEFIVKQEGQQIGIISGKASFTQSNPPDFVNLALINNALTLEKPSELDFVLKFIKDGEVTNELLPPSFKVYVNEAK
jgi:hypothetical protein